MKEGWKVKVWSDVLEIRSGRNQKQVICPDGIYPILGSAGKVMGYANEYLCEGNATIIGRKGTIDKPLFIESKFWNVDTAFGLIAGEELHSKFLHYFCLGYNFLKHNKGTTLPSLVKKDLVKIPIPVPPLAEQEAIVEVLDKAFAAIDQAKANIEQNIANAKELFQSKLNQIFSQKGEGWVEKTLDEVCTIGDGNHSSKYPKKSEMVDSGVSFIRGVNIINGSISDVDMRYITEEKHLTLRKGHLESGDILFTNRGEIGKLGIVDKAHHGSNLNSQIAWLRCNPECINKFLFYQLKSPQLKAHYLKAQTGAALQQYPIKNLKATAVSLAPIEEQELHIKQLDNIHEATNNAVAIYAKKLDSLDELKKSILQKAFAGELT